MPKTQVTQMREALMTDGGRGIVLVHSTKITYCHLLGSMPSHTKTFNGHSQRLRDCIEYVFQYWVSILSATLRNMRPCADLFSSASTPITVPASRSFLPSLTSIELPLAVL